MLGINGPPAFADANGILVEKMALEFGWTKTPHSSAMLLQMPLGLLPFALGLLMLGSHLCSWRFDQYLFYWQHLNACPDGLGRHFRSVAVARQLPVRREP